MDYSLETLNSKNNQFQFQNLQFHFDYKNRFVHCHYGDKSQYQFQTSLLKVLKPLHISSNKKNKKSNKYIIIEINQDIEVSNNLSKNELENNYLMVIVNKLHELSQENIQKNSIQWFNIELDDFDLDMKVKRPIDQQKNIQFIKILIHNEEELLQKIEQLEKNTYISMDIRFNGLRICSDHLMEEWELMDFTNQEEKELQLNEYIENKIDNSNLLPLITNENNSYEKNIEINIEKLNDSQEESMEESHEKIQDESHEELQEEPLEESQEESHEKIQDEYHEELQEEPQEESQEVIINEEKQDSENQENNEDNINNLNENNLNELNPSEIYIEKNINQDYCKEEDALEENQNNEENNIIENKEIELDPSNSLIEDSSLYKENLDINNHLENNIIINDDIKQEEIIQNEKNQEIINNDVENQHNENLEIENQKEINQKRKKEKRKNKKEKNIIKQNENQNLKIKEIEEYSDKKSDIIQIRKNKYIKKKKKIIIW